MSSVATAAAGQFVRFPPGRRNVLVPLLPAAATGVGISLYSAARPVPLLAQRVLWAMARIGGGRLLPGARELWLAPMGHDVLAELTAQWDGLLGGHTDGVAVYQRLQAHRGGTVLMLCAGARSLIVRVREDEASMQLERRVSEAANVLAPRTFRVPSLMGNGSAGGWHWVAYEAMSQRPHKPARRASPRLIEDVTGLVESVLDAPAGTPAHWRGAHCDLTPWNLRRANSITWLIDWEDMRWAPPGTDQVHFAAVVAAMKSGRLPDLGLPEKFPEACRYWVDIIGRREFVNGAEKRVYGRVLRLLDASIGA